MNNEKEILNIDYHVKRMCLKALNKYNGNREKAGVLLGISSRTLTRYIRMYHLKRIWEDGYIRYEDERKLKIV